MVNWSPRSKSWRGWNWWLVLAYSIIRLGKLVLFSDPLDVIDLASKFLHITIFLLCWQLLVFSPTTSTHLYICCIFHLMSLEVSNSVIIEEQSTGAMVWFISNNKSTKIVMTGIILQGCILRYLQQPDCTIITIFRSKLPITTTIGSGTRPDIRQYWSHFMNKLGSFLRFSPKPEQELRFPLWGAKVGS